MGMGINTDQALSLSNQAIQSAQGMALQSRGISKQVKGQKQIMKEQAKYAKQLSDYQQAQQLETWKATSYPAQMEQIKKAGLNAGLMYGMGGGGGVTTGAPMQTGVSGGNIDASIPTFGLMAQQQQSQIELTKAQTANINADTAKKTGVDTEKTTAETQNILALAKNEQEKNEMIKLEKDFQRVKNKIQHDTMEEAIAVANYQYDNLWEDVREKRLKNDFTAETYETAAKIKNQELANMIAEKGYIIQKTGESRASTSAISEEERMNIKRTIEGIEQKWAEINNNATGKNNIHETNEYKELVNTIGALGTSAVISILSRGKTGSMGGFGKGLIKK